ncbi:3-hydroxyacyl-CoA dehydrogenase NAD-binding domain-containing protein [Halomonas sp. I1]|uniref:3-hydroxyacyl-CoA dehydrogenase NAD-binding domain-containing protein n=1 Tax=Halomonas sp. I1 TaxID=393536 RepID=UPI0028DD76AA|nr:3-hydroxyacyl-CoA dehydrogenase NAD-binding domain-containing protein [Halomonas sp. I1]MDT8895731.1 3-hydroxyacyl-CoA dehydrogenase NAD-binding domain-containing protein [Halomonas sp. I1]
MQAFHRVVVIGAGTMGVNLARLILRRGMSVTVLDIDPDGLARCRKALRGESGHGGQARFVSAWEQVGTCEVVLESVTEDLALKQRVLKETERHVGDATLILTNTSGLSIDELADGLVHPERFVGAHFFNPADLIPAVEVVPGHQSSAMSVEQAADWLRHLGKHPAVLKRGVPGFVANRLQHALMRECLALLEQDVVDAETLDDIVRYSIGIRLAINGPLRQRDLNGLDTHLNIARYLYRDLESGTAPASLLEDLVAQGRLGRKKGHGFHEWPEGSGEAYDKRERALLESLLALMEKEAG